ncbi:MAG TPA: VWA domain-containing protein [Fimbriiglobus sp.]|nr:VWA domain-containing protein [Fimbriiglobus sp.]
MRLRPKPPSLVSMWMLDVFCCALGCVTLLWLLNTREAGEQAKRAGSALEVLHKTKTELNARKAELLATKADLDQTRRKLNADIEDLQGKLLAMTSERDETAKKLALTRGDLAAAQSKLVAAVNRSQELDDLLTRKQKEAKDLSTRLASATVSADELAKLLRRRERERNDLAMKAKAAEEQLDDADAKLKAVAREAKDANANLAAMRKTGDELAAARSTIKDLRKKMDDSNATLIDLQGQKAKLADKYDKLRIESESRFAGIAMTGRRVVLVVDFSGSMKDVANGQPDPNKWPTVVETVAKVMRSLPDLEKFQVVIFSRQASYLFGSGEWQPYQGEASVKRVADALRRIEPAGDTNLYDGLDLAFRLRRDGLDTVYLFSDGLPTSGPGLTSEQERTLKETDRADRLGRHIRLTLNVAWNRAVGGRKVRINAVGFFYESPELGSFLWTLARENDGSFVGMSRP